MAFTNAKQHVPKVFKDIEENHTERERLKAQPVISFRDVGTYKALKDDMDNSLRPAAENLLKWNKDKGDGLGRR